MCAGAATTSRSAGAENYMRYIAIRDSVELLDTGGYMKYIAERLRSHVLFSNGKVVDLKQMMNKVSAHPGSGLDAGLLPTPVRGVPRRKAPPHIHLMVWSATPAQGYLTTQGIEKIRSKLTIEENVGGYLLWQHHPVRQTDSA